MAVSGIASMGSCRIEERVMTIKIAQDVERTDEKYWRWSVWLDAPEEELKNVEWVLWKLDPSFSPSQVRVDTRSDGFRLRNSGWGEFEIEAEIHRPDGVTSLRDRLHFEDTPRHPKLFISYGQTDARLARSLTNILKEEYEFTVLLDIDVPPGEDLRRWVNEKLDECDAVIILGSHSDPYFGYEMGYLLRREHYERRFIPKIMVGSQGIEEIAAKLTGNLNQFDFIQTNDGVSAAAIAGRIKEIVDRRLREREVLRSSSAP
jgi:TIR domain/YEATS family